MSDCPSCGAEVSEADEEFNLCFECGALLDNGFEDIDNGFEDIGYLG